MDDINSYEVLNIGKVTYIIMKISFCKKEFQHRWFQHCMYVDGKLNPSGYRIVDIEKNDDCFILIKFNPRYQDSHYNQPYDKPYFDFERIAVDTPYCNLEEAKYDLINFYYQSLKKKSPPFGRL